MDHLFLAAFLSLLIGTALGLLGGGGGILAVPLLVYVLGVGAKLAIATSLFFVGATSAVGAGLAAREGRVRWKMGGIFGAGSMTGAFVGGKLAGLVPEHLLLGGLATVMLVTALAMQRGRRESAPAPRSSSLARVLLVGATVGVVSGLVGAGGGFLIVPALTLFGGLAMRDAIGTSLFIISIQSFAGFAGHLGHVELTFTLIAVMTAAAIVGMVVGESVGKRVSADGLKRGFTGLVLATGLFMLGRQLPPLWTALAAAVALVLTLLVGRRKAAPPIVPASEQECTTSVRIQP